MLHATIQGLSQVLDLTHHLSVRFRSSRPIAWLHQGLPPPAAVSHHRRSTPVQVLERPEQLRRVPQRTRALRPPRRAATTAGCGVGSGRAGGGVGGDYGAGLHQLKNL